MIVKNQENLLMLLNSSGVKDWSDLSKVKGVLCYEPEYALRARDLYPDNPVLCPAHRRCFINIWWIKELAKYSRNTKGFNGHPVKCFTDCFPVLPNATVQIKSTVRIPNSTAQSTFARELKWL